MAKKRLSPAGQMLVAAGIAEGISVLMLLVAFFFTAGSTSVVVTVFLVALVLGSIAAGLAALLALVGLVKFREYTLWLSFLLVAAFVFNPLTIFMGLVVFSGV
ncbi:MULTISPECIES: hypothetical protein [unclassified Rothia (in: high G+C Gram-positive bacteria)]|uniref:hypothetical protein n=1 Tax=unclassified Rothia (in: high G+C Gram-positive bacteria) TaxID=2689056 RepID=UPI001956D5DE|nr:MULTISPECIES: hypothetical protein [unclassified Rothia (in: high G+C Gram-positive bacteria)]MBM7051827.1 hypothetical protein [Rothia sp. ZJ1223]QRZ61557.1 hypothetical protein JR346_10175 [Rothia sp. ZJ932]